MRGLSWGEGVMNSMQDALQGALERPVDAVTGKEGAEMHLGPRDYFWWGVAAYAVGVIALYGLSRAGVRG
jgi:hypothetical protein